ncbi:MAG: hypothetical protein R2854_19545 [Caldilineaceae bacterium]
MTAATPRLRRASCRRSPPQHGQGQALFVVGDAGWASRFVAEFRTPWHKRTPADVLWL